LPRRRTEEQRTDHAPVPIPNQVLEVLPDRVLQAQVVMLRN